MSLLGALLPTNAANTKTPVPLVGRSQSGIWGNFVRRSDTTSLLSSMEAIGTVFGIVDKLAGDTSRVEWKLWAKAKSGKAEDRKEITSHLALDIWRKPNKFFTTQELVETGQQHSDLTGETWLVVARDPRAKSIPLELWPIRPDRMTPVPSAETFLSGYVYQSPDGEQVPLELTDVLFIRRPDPNNLYRGLGPLKASMIDVESSRFAAEWNRNFFLNSAEPGGIIEVEKTLSDPEFNEMRDRWAEQHRGVANAHRVAILEHGKWVNKGYPSMRDMQFAELRGVSSTAIREAFGFPKFMLGDVTDVNRSNADASEAMFAKHLIVPRLERWKQMLNTEFLPLFGPAADGLEFDYTSPVSEDSEAANASRDSRVSAAAQLIPLGFDPADTLKAFELPKIKFTPPQPMAPMGADPNAMPLPGEEPFPAEALSALPAARLDPFQTLAARLLTPPIRNHPGHPDQSVHGRRKGVRKSLALASDLSELAAAAMAEAKSITGRDIGFDFTGSDIQIGREHAEGILKGLEAFPKMPLRAISTFGPGGAQSLGDHDADAVHSFAATRGGSYDFPDDVILFNTRFASDPQRYRTSLELSNRAHWAATGTPEGVAQHELGHVVSHFASGEGYAYGLLRDRTGRKTSKAIDRGISRLADDGISAYAATSLKELVAEAFADVMANGDAATPLSREVFDELSRVYELRAAR